MDRHNHEQSVLLSVVSLLTTIGYLYRDPSFTWIGSLPYLLPSLTPLLLSVPSWTQFKSFFNNCSRNRSNPIHIEFTARLKLRSWMDEPDSVVRNFAIMLWEWNRNNKVVNCKFMMEEALNRYYDNEEMTRIITPIFVDDQSTPFWNIDNPSIQYTMWVDRPVDRDGVAMPEIFLRFRFLDPNYTPKKIVEHIEWIKTEAKKINDARKKIQRVLVSTEDESLRDNNDKNNAAFMIYEFSTTSSFSNFFATEASQVKEDLDHFLKNQDAYYRTGRPWTYTILNEGVPGVGKTKLVKAIAAYTGATLIVLNLQHIQDIRTLYNVFHSSVLGGEHVPHNQRVYYIPEVDTQALESLGKRNDTKPVRVSTNTTDLDTTSSLIMKKKPTLGEILNVLDGVPERHGHILIMDTNHLTKLDPAMIRPGRVDRILTWRRMSGENVRKYLENLYNTTIPKSVVFPDDKWTAAELQALAYRASSWDILSKQLDAEKLNSRNLDRPKRACHTRK